MQSVIEPEKIAAIYCRGKRDLHDKSVLIEASLLAEEAKHKLKNSFGLANDRFSLSSAEAYLSVLGYDQKTIREYSMVVEKAVDTYKGVIADVNGHWPEYTFNRDYYLGFHIDGKPLADEDIIEAFETDVRRKLVLQRNGASPLYTVPVLVPRS